MKKRTNKLHHFGTERGKAWVGTETVPFGAPNSLPPSDHDSAACGIVFSVSLVLIVCVVVSVVAAGVVVSCCCCCCPRIAADPVHFISFSKAKSHIAKESTHTTHKRIEHGGSTTEDQSTLGGSAERDRGGGGRQGWVGSNKITPHTDQYTKPTQRRRRTNTPKQHANKKQNQTRTIRSDPIDLDILLVSHPHVCCRSPP